MNTVNTVNNRLSIEVIGDLTVYLKNIQWAEWCPPRPGTTPWAEVGFLAICEQAPEADWYVTILYHEIFLATDLTPLRLPPWPPIGGESGQGEGTTTPRR